MRYATRGRGTTLNTPNRFAKLHLEPLDLELPPGEEQPAIKTRYYQDTSRSVLAKNESPDIPFTYSINPYRGCEHGCIYCYARPSHEYLGFSAGLDFESQIMVKLDAPQLLERTLRKGTWVPQMVALSGNTDCYQPVERELKLTRECLKVFLKYRNPVGIVTKNALILRDIDILKEMAQHTIVHVMVSVTTLDDDLVRKMEPRTSTPAKRLDTIAQLAGAGIPVGVNAAPIIPGLTDEEIPAILKEAAGHGATTAGYLLVRLPGAVKPLFLDWIRRNFPDRAGKILNRIKDTHDGLLSDPRFGVRMTGEGGIARAIQALFDVHAAKYNLQPRWCGLNTDGFTRPGISQMSLFENGSI
jgi:DNA repair photolyase